MLSMNQEVYRTIPHRPPFLFVDEIVDRDAASITTRRTLRADEAHFEGHYPGNPIMPGVLLCEAVFQTGAILLAGRTDGEIGNLTPVLTRIRDARFKNIARPGDELTIRAAITETQGRFSFLRGSIVSGEKKIMTVDFGLALIDENRAAS